MERFITLSSDFNDYYIKEFNTEHDKHISSD